MMVVVGRVVVSQKRESHTTHTQIHIEHFRPHFHTDSVYLIYIYCEFKEPGIHSFFSQGTQS